MSQLPKVRESQQTHDNRYKDILITILAVTILPILIINAIFYFYNIRRFEQSYLDVRISQLKQSGTSAKEIVHHIDVIMNILGENEDIIDFIINPEESDYEQLTAIHKFLNGFIVSGQSLRSIYIYSKTSGLVISSDSGLHKIQDFFDTDWIDDFDTHFLGRENLDTRRVQINNKEFRFISFMRNLPLGTWSKTGGIVINLNEDLFYEDTFPSENDVSRGFVINSEGRIVSHYNKNVLGQFYWNELNGEIGGEEGSFKRNNKIPCYIKDDYSKWGFILEIDVSEVFDSFRTYLLITLLLFFLVIAIIVFLDIKLSRQFYQPVKLLGDVRKEFEYAKPLIEGKILNNIIQNRYSSEQGIVNDLNLIDMNFTDSSSVVILISIDKYEELIEKEEYQSLAMLKLSLQHFLYRILDESFFSYLYSETKRDQICLLINMQSSSLIEQQEKLISLSERILKQTAEEFPFTVTIGIGDVYKKAMNLHLSYQEAKNAVKYKLIHGQNQVIKYADVKNNESRIFSFKSPYEKQIIQSIQLGLSDEVEAQVHNLCHDIRQSENYDINFVKYTLNRIVHDLLERYRKEDEEDHSSLLREFDRLETIEDIESWMVRNIRQFALANGSKKTTENQVAAKKIGEYINRNIANKNISLVDIGDALGLTPSYISRIFKESYGYNYLEYLNRSRIDKAKELLSSSNLSIAEIGDSIGFSSTQSFLRVFQRYEKTSPGRYRKSLADKI